MSYRYLKVCVTHRTTEATPTLPPSGNWVTANTKKNLKRTEINDTETVNYGLNIKVSVTFIALVQHCLWFWQAHDHAVCPTWRHTLVFEASGGPAAVFLDRAWILGFTATFEYSITNGQAVLRGAGINGRGGARLLRSRKDAWRPQEVLERRVAEALAVCRAQHRLKNSLSFVTDVYMRALCLVWLDYVRGIWVGSCVVPWTFLWRPLYMTPGVPL